jgi:uncharacterized membrane-anchored protein
MNRVRGAIAGGVVCLMILGGMIVGHAWPLWRGQDIVLAVRPVDPRDPFRGEFVRLWTPANLIEITSDGRANGSNRVAVRPGADWVPLPDDHSVRRREIGGRLVYLQLERDAASGEHRPVSITRAPQSGAANLRGRVLWAESANELRLDFGLDAYYMQEGTALPVEQAIANGRRVQMVVAVSASGRARLRTLLVDQVPVNLP